MKRILFLILGLNLLSFCIDLKGTTGSLYAQESQGSEEGDAFEDHDGDGIDDEWDEDCQCYQNYKPIYGTDQKVNLENPDGTTSSIVLGDDNSTQAGFGDAAMLSLAYASLEFIETDIAIPDPSDLVWYKWAGYGVVAVVAGAVIYYNYQDDKPTIVEYVPAPKTLPGFPQAGSKTYYPESGRSRWWLPDGTILEWDKQHGEVEVYDKQGRHKGVADPDTGEMIKPPVDGRTTAK